MGSDAKLKLGSVRSELKRVANDILMLLKRYPDLQKTIVKEQFDCFDLNGDGTIDRSELAQLLRSLDDRGTWTDQNLDFLLDSMDKNKDGVIQYSEWLDWVFGAGATRDGLNILT